MPEADSAPELNDARSIAAAVYREQSGRILATLIRLSNSFDRAEEALQDALTSALETWPARGTPENPAAWITATAHRKLIDMARRESTRRIDATQPRDATGRRRWPCIFNHQLARAGSRPQRPHE